MTLKTQFDIKPEHIHPMLGIANSQDDVKFIHSIADINPTSHIPDECIRMVFDALVALGKSVPDEWANKPNPLPKDAASAIAAAAATSKASKSH